MENQKLGTSTSESDPSDEGSHWSSKKQSYRWQKLPVYPQILAKTSVFRGFIEQLMSTIGLVIAILGPPLLFTAAVNGLLIFVLASLIYVLAGSLGALIIMKVRKADQTTSVVPNASCEYQTRIRDEAFGSNEKAA